MDIKTVREMRENASFSMMDAALDWLDRADTALFAPGEKDALTKKISRAYNHQSPHRHSARS